MRKYLKLKKLPLTISYRPLYRFSCNFFASYAEGVYKEVNSSNKFDFAMKKIELFGILLQILLKMAIFASLHGLF